ncbi:conserved hypothetical protein, partial [Ricinus communis]
RPQRQQHQPLAGVRREPGLAQALQLAAVEQAAHRQHADQAAERAADGVGIEIEVGRDAGGQVGLHRLHGAGHQRAAGGGDQQRPEVFDARIQRVDDQRAERDVADDVGDGVEHGPPARQLGGFQEDERRQALVVPARKREPAGVDDQEQVGQQRRARDRRRAGGRRERWAVLAACCGCGAGRGAGWGRCRRGRRH